MSPGQSETHSSAPARWSAMPRAVIARIRVREFGVVMAFVAMLIALSLLSDRFLSVSNLSNVVQQSAVIAIVGFGMTAVILASGIDLSVGSVLALTAAVAATWMQSGVDPWLAALGALALGAGIGALTGLVIAWSGIQDFIATLAALSVYRGLTLLHTGGYPITGEAMFAFSTAFAYSSILGVPTPILVVVATMAVLLFLLRMTALGRSIYAVGGNREAAFLSGIPVRGIRVLVYAISGLCAALAGLVLAGRLASAQPTAGAGLELDAIAAVVIGGTSLFGGRGGVLGTLIGALIMGTLLNGMNLLDVNAFYQQVIKGLVILAAVLIDRRPEGG